MIIIKFLIEHWSDVTLIFGVIGGLIAVIRHGEISILRNIGLNFVTEAEKLYGSGVGILKKSVVLEWLYDNVPTYLKPLFTEKTLGKLIDDIILPTAKEYWAKNPAMLEYINGIKMDSDNA